MNNESLVNNELISLLINNPNAIVIQNLIIALKMIEDLKYWYNCVYVVASSEFALELNISQIKVSLIIMHFTFDNFVKKLCFEANIISRKIEQLLQSESKN